MYCSVTRTLIIFAGTQVNVTSSGWVSESRNHELAFLLKDQSLFSSIIFDFTRYFFNFCSIRIYSTTVVHKCCLGCQGHQGCWGAWCKGDHSVCKQQVAFDFWGQRGLWCYHFWFQIVSFVFWKNLRLARSPFKITWQLRVRYFLRKLFQPIVSSISCMAYNRIFWSLGTLLRSLSSFYLLL